MTEGKGFWYNAFCAGGINKKDPLNEKDNRDNVFMAFFRDVFAAILNKVSVKVIVLIIFAGYLAVSGWAVSRLKEGLKREHLARSDSYSIEFYDKEETLFKDYPFRVHVSVTQSVLYIRPTCTAYNSV